MEIFVLSKKNYKNNFTSIEPATNYIWNVLHTSIVHTLKDVTFCISAV